VRVKDEDRIIELYKTGIADDALIRGRDANVNSLCEFTNFAILALVGATSRMLRQEPEEKELETKEPEAGRSKHAKPQINTDGR